MINVATGLWLIIKDLQEKSNWEVDMRDTIKR